jgi:hypothetical protein
MKNRNSHAKAEIRNGKVIVSIGIETLAWAAQPENGGTLGKFRIKVGKEDEWARDVVREMNYEEGDFESSPRFCKWLDEMMGRASENGSGAQQEIEDSEISLKVVRY